jgi:hypothetical protein
VWDIFLCGETSIFVLIKNNSYMLYI